VADDTDERAHPSLNAQDHVQWIADEVDLLMSITDEEVDEATPSCPGWTVGIVLDHLARGAGMGWATWFRDSATIDGMAVLASLPPATTGTATRSLFHEIMPDYVKLLRATPADKDCFWFTGPVPAAYLFQLGAIEMATHRADIDLALGRLPRLATARALDAVHASAQFMPALWSMRGEPTPPPLQLQPTEGPATTIGAGTPAATATGSATDLWLRLWGRPATDPIAIDGNVDALDRWAASAPTSPI